MNPNEGPKTQMEQSVQEMERAILDKNNSEGFENQNDAQNFFMEQFQKFFPDSPLAEDFFQTMSWPQETLCIMNVCRFAEVERKPEKQSFYLRNWDSKIFKEALLRFFEDSAKNSGL